MTGKLDISWRANNRITPLRGVLFWMSCLMLIGSLSAAELAPGVQINIQATPRKATVGDPIHIDLDVVLPKGFQVSTPRLSGQTGDFTILEIVPNPESPNAQAEPSPLVHHRLRIITALYKTGEFEFPPIALPISGPDGKMVTVASPPVKVQIQSILTEKDAGLRDLKRQAEIPEPIRWLLWLSLAGLALFGIALYLWLRRRRKIPVSQQVSGLSVDPLGSAETDLRDLMARDLLESGAVKQFYIALAEIVKRILEAGYRIQTLEKTTSEIANDLSGESSLADAGEDFGKIEALLTLCDLVKFAKYMPSGTESEHACKGAFAILETARKKRASPSTQEAAAASGAL